jgi:hypothetical protein
MITDKELKSSELFGLRGLKRDTIDKFYTTNKTVVECIQFIKCNLIIDKSDLIIEPSAGNGAFKV